jgi:hypothetical protein
VAADRRFSKPGDRRTEATQHDMSTSGRFRKTAAAMCALNCSAEIIMTAVVFLDAVRTTRQKDSAGTSCADARTGEKASSSNHLAVPIEVNRPKGDLQAREFSYFFSSDRLQAGSPQLRICSQSLNRRF